eukprot:COSAG02_NODE_8481_length_2554_cov_7.631738_3_plen_97_part_00
MRSQWRLQLLEDEQAVAPVFLDTTDGELDETLYYVLLRKSLLGPAWNQTEDVTMADFSSELWGLSTIWLGNGFYESNGAWVADFRRRLSSRSPSTQ